MNKDFVNILAAIQAEIKVNKSLTNNFGNYNYRNVEMILAEVKPILAKHNLVLTIKDDICEVAGRFYIKATATLSNGTDSVETTAYAREAESKKGMDDAQLTGACSSYARKYALGGLFLLDDNKDIDSMDNSQSGATTQKAAIKANVKANDTKEIELRRVKEKLFEELQLVGIEKAQMKKFIDWAGIDTSSKDKIVEALQVDLKTLASQFFETLEAGQAF